jgi:hypothetical protein
MNPRQPLTVDAIGTIKVVDGILIFGNWRFDYPVVTPHLLHGWSLFAGWSAKELHEMSHGTDCQCPVTGFEPRSEVLALRYDERPPYVIDIAECTAMDQS